MRGRRSKPNTIKNRDLLKSQKERLSEFNKNVLGLSAPAPMNDEPIEKVGNSNSDNSSVSGTISISENKEPRNSDSEINNIVSDQFFKHLINSETSNDKKRKQADTTDPENTSNYKKMTTMNTQPKANAAAQNARRKATPT
ncbi:hypothetical protein CBL_20704, partial [Carabus blaptoides fortunei]